MKKIFFFDVDGVIIGTRKGFNYPLPHPDVIEFLKKLKKDGNHVCLCTGRAACGVKEIVRLAELTDLHITDGGIVISNPVNGDLFRCLSLPKMPAKNLVDAFLKNNIYLEIYTTKDYYVLKSKICDYTTIHEEILGCAPVVVDSFDQVLSAEEITKIFLITKGIEEKETVDKLFNSLNADLKTTWSTNPNMPDCNLSWISPKGISKAEAVKIVAKHYGVELLNCVGFGDTETDIEFVLECGESVTFESGEESIRMMVLEKGGVILKGVDVNGVLDI